MRVRWQVLWSRVITAVVLAVGVLVAPAFVGEAVADDRAAPGVHPLIVDGEPATENYPWMVSLFAHGNGNHFCGAVLVSPVWAVTATHCTTLYPAPQARVGSPHRSSGGETVNVSGVAVIYGDFALVRLERAVSAKPITRATISPAPGTAVRILGWGQTCAPYGCTDRLPEDLRQLDTTIAEDSRCTNGYRPESELCVSNAGARGACYGDSGGPALVQGATGWELVGTTSRAGSNSSTCGVAPAIYNDTVHFEPWIQQVIGQGYEDL